MTAPAVSHLDPFTVLDRIRNERHGFLLDSDVKLLAQHQASRLWPVLIRCGGCRLTCAVQDVEHLVAIITAEGRDYVRDVSLIAGQVYR